MPLNRKDKQKLHLLGKRVPQVEHYATLHTLYMRKCRYVDELQKRIEKMEEESEPESKKVQIRALKADNAYRVISEMDRYLRDRIKYWELEDIGRIRLQDARDELQDLMKDNGIDLENDWS